MGRFYSGDIQGKFWFAVQDSDDADFFGVEHVKVYNRKCGCLYSEEDECCCEVEHEHNFKDSEEYDDSKSTCDPNCEIEFDENTKDEESYNSIEYDFSEEHIPKVREGIERCIQSLDGHHEKLEDYFKNKDSYNDKELSEYLNIEQEKMHGYLEWYARLELGKKILHCLDENGTCSFECEL
jgi:hypothetical protein